MELIKPWGFNERKAYGVTETRIAWFVGVNVFVVSIELFIFEHYEEMGKITD